MNIPAELKRLNEQIAQGEARAATMAAGLQELREAVASMKGSRHTLERLEAEQDGNTDDNA